MNGCGMNGNHPDILDRRSFFLALDVYVVIISICRLPRRYCSNFGITSNEVPPEKTRSALVDMHALKDGFHTVTQLPCIILGKHCQSTISIPQFNNKVME